MRVITFLLLLVGFIFFFLATFGINITDVNEIAAGLACWILVAVLGAVPADIAVRSNNPPQ